MRRLHLVLHRRRGERAQKAADGRVPSPRRQGVRDSREQARGVPAIRLRLAARQFRRALSPRQDRRLCRVFCDRGARRLCRGAVRQPETKPQAVAAAARQAVGMGARGAGDRRRQARDDFSCRRGRAALSHRQARPRRLRNDRLHGRGSQRRPWHR